MPVNVDLNKVIDQIREISSEKKEKIKGYLQSFITKLSEIENQLSKTGDDAIDISGLAGEVITTAQKLHADLKGWKVPENDIKIFMGRLEEIKEYKPEKYSTLSPETIPELSKRVLNLKVHVEYLRDRIDLPSNKIQSNIAKPAIITTLLAALAYSLFGQSNKYIPDQLIEALCLPIFSQCPVTWKVIDYFEDLNDTGKVNKVILSDSLNRLRDKLMLLSNNKFILEIEKPKPPNTAQDQIVEKIKEGKDLQAGFVGMYNNPNAKPALFFAEAIPFGFNPLEQNLWLNYKKANYDTGEKRQLIPNNDDDFSYAQLFCKYVLDHKAVPFPLAATSPQMGGWWNKQLTKWDDAKDLKMRIPGLGGKILKDYFSLKTFPDFNEEHILQPIPISELAERFSLVHTNNDRELDAVEFTTPSDEEILGIYSKALEGTGTNDKDKREVYYYYPGWWEPGSTFNLYVNYAAWQKLPTDYKEMLRRATKDIYEETLLDYYEKSKTTIDAIAKESETKDHPNFHLKPFENEMNKVALEKTKEFFKTYIESIKGCKDKCQDIKDAKDIKDFEEIYREWRKFGKKIRQLRDWSKYALKQDDQALFDDDNYKPVNE